MASSDVFSEQSFQEWATYCNKDEQVIRNTTLPKAFEWQKQFSNVEENCKQVTKDIDVKLTGVRNDSLRVLQDAVNLEAKRIDGIRDMLTTFTQDLSNLRVNRSKQLQNDWKEIRANHFKIFAPLPNQDEALRNLVSECVMSQV